MGFLYSVSCLVLRFDFLLYLALFLRFRSLAQGVCIGVDNEKEPHLRVVF